MIPPSVTLEPLVAKHWPAVEAIYAEGIATGDATFEVVTPGWKAWNETHRPDCRFVAVVDDSVVGWAALSPVSQREVYRGVAEVSVYVADGFRGLGVGTRLLRAVVETSESAGVWMLQASVFPENGATLRLHEGLGFRVVGRRTRIGRQSGRWRDTFLLERRSEVVGTT